MFVCVLVCHSLFYVGTGVLFLYNQNNVFINYFNCSFHLSLIYLHIVLYDFLMIPVSGGYTPLVINNETMKQI